MTTTISPFFYFKSFITREIQAIEEYILQLKRENAKEALVTYYEGRRDAFKSALAELKKIKEF